jgi:glutamate racemase
MNRAPIGIFDSGIGGLTVARAIYRHLPQESTIYFGDTARVPYGSKSPDTVRRYSEEILHWLLRQDVKAVVVACNTSTAYALDRLQQQSPVPVIGVVEPGAAAAARACRDGTIGVIGTAGTVASGAYPHRRVIQQACPLFVPLVEEGWFDHPATELVASEYLAPLRRAGVDALVLGCTHYPLLTPLLARLMGPGVILIDSAEETASTVADTLAALGLAASPPHTLPNTGASDPPSHRYVVSDDSSRFLTIGARFLGERLTAVELAAWE